MLKNLVQFFIASLSGGVVAALITPWFAKRYEQQQWLRNQKLQASAQFLRAIQGMSNEMLNFENGQGDTDKFFEHQVESERSLVELISPPSVITAAKAIADSVGDWAKVDRTAKDGKSEIAFYAFRDRMMEFTRAVRRDLKTDGDDNPKPRWWNFRMKHKANNDKTTTDVKVDDK